MRLGCICETVAALIICTIGDVLTGSDSSCFLSAGGSTMYTLSKLVELEPNWKNQKVSAFFPKSFYYKHVVRLHICHSFLDDFLANIIY